MKILVDTTISKQATVSFFKEGKLVVQKFGADALTLIAEILEEQKISWEEVDFELRNEKGSYTGLKVGATLVNTLNFLKDKDTLVIPEY